MTAREQLKFNIAITRASLNVTYGAFQRAKNMHLGMSSKTMMKLYRDLYALRYIDNYTKDNTIGM